jgi:hypothetical protein
MKYTKRTPKHEKERKNKKHPQNPKTGDPNTPTGISLQNLETITSQQGTLAFALDRTKTPSIIINQAL